MTTAQKALELIEPIPVKDFIGNIFSNEKDKCCVLGHINRLSNNPEDYSYSNCINSDLGHQIRGSSSEFLNKWYNTSWVDIADVNNEPNVTGFKKGSRKARVVKLLKQMIENGY